MKKIPLSLVLLLGMMTLTTGCTNHADGAKKCGSSKCGDAKDAKKCGASGKCNQGKCGSK